MIAIFYAPKWMTAPTNDCPASSVEAMRDSQSNTSLQEIGKNVFTAELSFFMQTNCKYLVSWPLYIFRVASFVLTSTVFFVGFSADKEETCLQCWRWQDDSVAWVSFLIPLSSAPFRGLTIAYPLSLSWIAWVRPVLFSLFQGKNATAFCLPSEKGQSFYWLITLTRKSQKTNVHTHRGK